MCVLEFHFFHSIYDDLLLLVVEGGEHERLVESDGDLLLLGLGFGHDFRLEVLLLIELPVDLRGDGSPSHLLVLLLDLDGLLVLVLLLVGVVVRVGQVLLAHIFDLFYRGV